MKGIRIAVLTGLLFAANVQASTIFDAFLDGPQEPTLSTATGFGTVVLNDLENMITVDMSWSGLIGGPATAAHIHCCAPPGTNAGVLFPFVIPNVTSGTMTEQTFAITPTQVAELEAGLMYMNIHDATFPGGEIRGQLLAATPEPYTVGFIGTVLVAMAGLQFIRRRRAAKDA